MVSWVSEKDIKLVIWSLKCGHYQLFARSAQVLLNGFSHHKQVRKKIIVEMDIFSILWSYLDEQKKKILNLFSCLR